MDGAGQTMQQANYALRSLPKGLMFLHVVSLSESPKVMGLVGIHDLDALCHFNGLTHCPWCGKEGQNEETVVNHLWAVHYRLGLVYNKCNNCPSTSVRHSLHATAGRTVSTQGRETQMNQFHQSSYHQETGRINVLAGDLNRGVQEKWLPLGCPVGDTPTHWHSPRGELMEKASPANQHIPSPIFPHILTRWPPTTPELHKMCLRFEVDNNKKND